jgi:mannitol PTS system EIIA component
MSILDTNRIQLDAVAVDKADAIRQAGELLVAGGCVTAEYVNGMLGREETMSTYLGNGVAIPHGQFENREQILQTGISVLRLREPVDWEDSAPVSLVFGIAALSDEHINVLSRIADAIDDEAVLSHLLITDEPGDFLTRLDAAPEQQAELPDTTE